MQVAVVVAERCSGKKELLVVAAPLANRRIVQRSVGGLHIVEMISAAAAAVARRVLVRLVSPVDLPPCSLG